MRRQVVGSTPRTACYLSKNCRLQRYCNRVRTGRMAAEREVLTQHNHTHSSRLLFSSPNTKLFVAHAARLPSATTDATGRRSGCGLGWRKGRRLHTPRKEEGVRAAAALIRIDAKGESWGVVPRCHRYHSRRHGEGLRSREIQGRRRGTQ